MTEAALPLFYFKASTPEGELFQGSLNARSETEAYGALRRSGYAPIRLSASPIQPSFLQREISFGSPKHLSLADCEAFCRELHILISAGIELVEALATFITSLPPRSRRRAFAVAVRHWVRMGQNLSQAIVRSGYSSPSDLVPVIQAGEETGSLASSLKTVAETYADRLRFQSLFTGALVYPVFLLLTAIVVLGVLAFFVAPNLATLFTSMERPPPAVIALLSDVAGAISGNLPLTGFALAALVGLTLLVCANDATKGLLLQLLFALPLVGEALSWSASRRFATTLRLYLLSNVAIASAVPSALAAAGLPGSDGYRTGVADALRRGNRLSDALRSHTRLPAKVIHLLRIGEDSARLPETLTAIADEANLRFGKTMALVSALLAPVLIVVVGAIIGSIILTVFTALLDINDLAIS
jgi:general secretion pathway protein F